VTSDTGSCNVQLPQYSTGVCCVCVP
jgi:hypothetical protein